MLTIKIGGVPEHFNYPWIKCIEQGLFKDIDATIQWVDCYGGTGEMSEALDINKIQIAIMLTEGSVRQIEKGKNYKIIQKYIESPLLWGIHVKYDSPLNDIDDLKNKTAAISRFNSGSHLMTYVLADNNQWDFQQLNFKVCKNLNGALDAIANNEADFLLWERFTTKPYVDNKTLKHIGNCPTPWPCFAIVTLDDYYNKNSVLIYKILNRLNSFTKDFKKTKNISKILSEKYNILEEDILTWLELTEWSQTPLDEETVYRIQSIFHKF